MGRWEDGEMRLEGSAELRLSESSESALPGLAELSHSTCVHHLTHHFTHYYCPHFPHLGCPSLPTSNCPPHFPHSARSSATSYTSSLSLPAQLIPALPLHPTTALSLR